MRRWNLVVFAVIPCVSAASHFAMTAVAQESDTVLEETFSDLAASPNAQGRLAEMVLVVPHWTHSNFSSEQALKVAPDSLARGYLELEYILKAAELAKAGGTVYTWANGTREMIDSANADKWIVTLKSRLGAYATAIESRGYQKLATAYDVTINGETSPSLIEQSGYKFAWSHGMGLYSGVVVEDAVAIENVSNPEVTFLGKITGTQITLRIEAVDISAETVPAGLELIWSQSDGQGRDYAGAYAARAMAKFEQGDCAKTIADATEAIERDSQLTTALSVRSQVYSSCPHAQHRDGVRAIRDAERYCELKKLDQTDRWVCSAILAAAYAENGEFNKAISSASVALKTSPIEMQSEMRRRLKDYKSGKPFRQHLEPPLLGQVLDDAPRQSPEWDWDLATRGIDLIAERFVPDSSPPGFSRDLRGLPHYRLKVTGSPKDTDYQLWMKRLGQEPEEIIMAQAEGYVVDDQVLLMRREHGEKGRFSLILGEGFARGEPIEYCLTSVDGSIRAFDKVIPIPLEATSGAGFRLSMEISNPRSYIIIAKGCEPNQEVKFFATDGSFSDLAGQTFDAKEGIGMFTGDAEEDESINAIVTWNAPRFRHGGSSVLKFVGKTGELSLGFDWGTAIYSPRSRAKERVESGSVWEEKDDYDKAIADYSEAIRIDPSYVAAHCDRGDAWQEKSEWDRAVADYTEAIRLDPTYSYCYLARGNAWSEKGELDKAIKDYTEAIRIDPESVWAYSYRGDAWKEKGALKKAIDDYTEAIRLDPSNSWCYPRRGAAWQMKAEYGKAIRDYAEAISLSPGDSWAYNNLAWLYATAPEAQFRDGQQSVALSLKSCELTNWKDYSVLDTLAAAYAESGEFDKAIRWQRKAIQLASEIAESDELLQRLDLYESGRPYREPAPDK